MDKFDLFWAFFSGLWIVLWIGVYIWTALCMQIIARKTYTPDAWLAWIPIANIYLMCRVAEKPGWWTVLFFIPIANIVFAVLVWMKVAEARGQPGWLGILIIVPVGNLVIPGILAFAS
ncbi:MAG: DUF5684 domain-containing protein [Chloroflexota bacterium]|nr:DUF5684 domain-containing protein [Chloroflexota bacterium]